ncbi:MAG: methionine--tRNA ligase subunit beta [Candidatus Aenigmatarchaeota archaeon]|nr:MAG: methionine--tRNA ligase subunit beta [Candidatus Aenigmarchaeota archaeon]
MAIKFKDFEKLEIKIGEILSAEKVEDSDKLLKLEVNLGDEKRQIVAGIAESFEPENLIGKEIPIIANLEPRKIRGVESQGMILVVDAKDKMVLLNPEEEVPPGSVVG